MILRIMLTIQITRRMMRARGWSLESGAEELGLWAEVIHVARG